MEHTIKPGETLSELAKLYDTSTTKLQELNADQIKDINVIYANDVIKIPDKVKIPEKATDLFFPNIEPCYKFSTQNLSSKACKPKIYVDALYVPKLPNSNGNKVILLTKEAQKAVKEEMNSCMSAVKGKDNIGIMKGLSKLGILDGINTHAHEKFLDKDDKLNYRTALNLLLWVKNILLNKEYLTYNDLYSNGKQEQISFPGGDEKIGFDDYKSQIIKKLSELDKQKETQLNMLYQQRDNYKLRYDKMSSSRFYTEESKIKAYEMWNDTKQDIVAYKTNHKKKVNSALRYIIKNAIESLSDHAVKKYEHKAKQNALKKHFTSADGKKHTYRFFVGANKQYYTSNNEVEIYKKLKALKSIRKSVGFPDELMIQDVDINTKIPYLTRSHLYYVRWKECIKEIGSKIKTSLDFTRYIDSYYSIDDTNAGIDKDIKDWVKSIYQLNLSGILIKEQVMTEKELYHGLSEVDALSFDENDRVNDILDKVKSLSIPIKEMGYQCCYALYLKLTEISTKRLNDFIKLTGARKSPYQQELRKLVTITSSVLNRYREIENNIKIKCRRAKSIKDIIIADTYIQTSENIIYADDNPIPHIIWNENEWVPKDRTNLIYNDSGKNEIFLVECSLASESQEQTVIGYVRSNLGIFQKFSDENSFTVDLPAISIGDATQAKFTRKFLAKEFKRKVTNIAQEQQRGAKENKEQGEDKDSKSAKLSTSLALYSPTGEQAQAQAQAQSIAEISDKKLTPWFVRETDLFGVKGRWESGSQAQFFRFIHEANSGLTTDPKVLGQNSSFTGKAVLAQASWNFDFKYPKDGTGKKFDIPYIYHEDGQRKHASYTAGEYKIHVNGSVQGFLGASIALSEQMELGYNSAGEFGVRGEFKNDAGALESSNEPISQNPDAYTKGITTGMNGSASAFAGMQFGGNVDCEFDWCPPKNATPSHLTTGQAKQERHFQMLAKVSSSVSLSAGAGVNGQCQLAFKNDCFIIVVSASATFGMGAGGSIGLEINPLQADNFFKTILNIMNQANYRYIEFFHEDENDPDGTSSFAAFNKVLSVMLMMGLTAGEVLCLPFKLIDSIHTQLLTKESSYLIADSITDKDLKQANIDFYRKAPPEVLAPILTSLLQYHEDSFFNHERESLLIRTKNVQQQEAIYNIFNWINPQGNSKNKRLLIESIQRIGLSKNEVLDKSKQWERFGRYFICIISFSYRVVSKLIQQEVTNISADALHNHNSLINICSNLISNKIFYYSPNSLSTPSRPILDINDNNSCVTIIKDKNLSKKIDVSINSTFQLLNLNNYRLGQHDE
nr:LysM peptidoglycan-binding domain-containing protein [Celerinatantimonas diazotrophica]